MHKGPMMITVGIACFILSGMLYFIEQENTQPGYDMQAEEVILEVNKNDEKEPTEEIEITKAKNILNFNEQETDLYYKVSDFFIEVASGKHERTEFSYGLDDNNYTWTYDEIGYKKWEPLETAKDTIMGKIEEEINVSDVVYAAVYNNSVYDFWTDKNNTYFYSLDIEYDEAEYSLSVKELNLYFSIGPSYLEDGSDDEFDINIYKVKNTMEQIEVVADEIIMQCDKTTDYDRIIYYAISICDLTVYDTTENVEEIPDISHRIVSVFDNNQYTMSVCDGYSKAFKYLCDRTKWQSDKISCEIISSVDHAWNMITMDDGKAYLIDVTWADNDETGLVNPDYLFVPTKLVDNKLILLPQDKYEDNSIRELEELSMLKLKDKVLAACKYFD